MSADAHVAGECCTHCAPEPPRSTAAQARGVLATIAFVLLAAGCLSELAGGAPAWTRTLFLVAVVAGAVFPARRAWSALRRGMLDIHVLMVIAVAGALVIGEWAEAAVVVFLFSVAQWLECAEHGSGARGDPRADGPGARSRRASRPRHHEHAGAASIACCPAPIDASSRPGESFPLDGVVTAGRSDVNQAPITGESLPVEKAPGDEVFAGTINGHGALDVRVTRRRARHDAGAHHPPRRARRRRERAPVAAVHRSLRALVHAGVVVARRRWSAAVPVLAGGAVGHVGLSRAGAAGRRLSVRARHLHAGVDRVGAGRRGAPRRAIKGGAAPRAARRVCARGLRQDRHAHARRARRRRRRRRRRRSSESTLLAAAAAVEQRSEHPIARRSWSRPRGARPRGRAADRRARRCPGWAPKGAWRRRAPCVRRQPRSSATRSARPSGRRPRRPHDGAEGVAGHRRAATEACLALIGVADRPRAIGARRGRDCCGGSGVAHVAHAHRRQRGEPRPWRSRGRRRRSPRRTAAGGQGRGDAAPCARARAASRWSATASTTPRRWPRPTSAS